MPGLLEQEILTDCYNSAAEAAHETPMPENSEFTPKKTKKQEPILLRWKVIFKQKKNRELDSFECVVVSPSTSQARRQAVRMAEGHGLYWARTAHASLKNLGKVKEEP